RRRRRRRRPGPVPAPRQRPAVPALPRRRPGGHRRHQGGPVRVRRLDVRAGPRQVGRARAGAVRAGARGAQGPPPGVRGPGRARVAAGARR
ncbi:unnamed protein product, partial [Prorocentrum cordatum]